MRQSMAGSAAIAALFIAAGTVIAQPVAEKVVGESVKLDEATALAGVTPAQVEQLAKELETDKEQVEKLVRTLLSVDEAGFLALQGDLNGDKQVDRADVELLAKNMGVEGEGAATAGDLTLDGIVDGKDLELLTGLMGTVPQTLTQARMVGGEGGAVAVAWIIPAIKWLLPRLIWPAKRLIPAGIRRYRHKQQTTKYWIPEPWDIIPEVPGWIHMTMVSVEDPNWPPSGEPVPENPEHDKTLSGTGHDNRLSWTHPNHEATTSAGWDGWGHDDHTSRSWPPNHTYAVSDGWECNWCPWPWEEHKIAVSYSWPADHPESTSGTWTSGEVAQSATLRQAEGGDVAMQRGATTAPAASSSATHVTNTSVVVPDFPPAHILPWSPGAPPPSHHLATVSSAAITTAEVARASVDAPGAMALLAHNDVTSAIDPIPGVVVFDTLYRVGHIANLSQDGMIEEPLLAAAMLASGHAQHVSRTWPPHHTTKKSDTQDFTEHYKPNSSLWTHEEALSKQWWVPNHARRFSNSWPNPNNPGGHAIDRSDTWVPNHWYHVSKTYPETHNIGTSRQWGPNHNMDTTRLRDKSTQAAKAALTATYNQATGATMIDAAATPQTATGTR